MTKKRAPTMDESMALIARQLLQINSRLGMINGWMDGQEKITSQQGKRMGNMEKNIKTLAMRRVEDGKQLKAATDAICRMVPQIEGTTQLSKSTYDMIVDMKKQSGGEDEPGKQAAQ